MLRGHMPIRLQQPFLIAEINLVNAHSSGCGDKRANRRCVNVRGLCRQVDKEVGVFAEFIDLFDSVDCVSLREEPYVAHNASASRVGWL